MTLHITIHAQQQSIYSGTGSSWSTIDSANRILQPSISSTIQPYQPSFTPTPIPTISPISPPSIDIQQQFQEQIRRNNEDAARRTREQIAHQMEQERIARETTARVEAERVAKEQEDARVAKEAAEAESSRKMAENPDVRINADGGSDYEKKPAELLEYAPGFGKFVYNVASDKVIDLAIKNIANKAIFIGSALTVTGAASIAGPFMVTAGALASTAIDIKNVLETGDSLTELVNDHRKLHGQPTVTKGQLAQLSYRVSVEHGKIMVNKINYEHAEAEGIDVNDLKVMSDSDIIGGIKDFVSVLYEHINYEHGDLEAVNIEDFYVFNLS